MLTVWHSNRAERLVEVLVEFLDAAPHEDPLEPDVVVVPTAAVGRWLTLRLAEARGITANVRFPLPTPFFWDLWRRVLDDVPLRSAYDKEILVWRVHEVLAGGLPDESRWAPLTGYLEAADPLRRWQLAGRIADAFDRYLLFRPDWIADWDRGGGEGWQPALWRRIARAAGPLHRVEAHRRFLETLARGQSAAKLPARVALFGLSALPPAQFEDLVALARSSDVHLLFTNPCEHDWSTLRPDREVAREILRSGRDADELHFEAGHSLLAACGRQGREFLTMVLDADDELVISEDRFEDPGQDTGLSRLQRAILQSSPEPVDVGDGSIEVHCCHGPMREIEVLHDRLLEWLDPSRGGRNAADVVVLTPSIETYAPMIEAVFGTRTPRIPFAIADRAQRIASPTIGGFLAALGLPGSRYEVGTVLALLDAPAVRERFEIAELELPEVRRLTEEAGIRWGIDAQARADLDLPSFPDNSWEAGLDRLTLGFAMRDEPPRLFHGIRPHDDVEGDTADLVARFVAFARTVLELPTKLEGDRTPGEWCERIAALLDEFLAPRDDSERDDVLALRAALRDLAADVAASEAMATVPAAVVVAELRTRLERPGRSGRFLVGGVTFCEMVPMRAVPFPIVAIVGLGFDAVPRPDREDDVDELTRRRRIGDRSRRQDDRYLFLEAVLAARDALLLTYPGRTLHNGEALPPSPLVEELLEAIRDRDAVVFEHPLQPFSPKYFAAPETRWFSYRSELAVASPRPGLQTPFVDAELPRNGPQDRPEVSLDALVRLLSRPARAYLERLGIRLEEPEGALARAEPFVVEGLAGWRVRDDLRNILLAGSSDAEAVEIVRAGGLLPPGELGRVKASRLAGEARRLLKCYREACGAAVPQALSIRVHLDSAALVGRLDGLIPGGRVAMRVGKISARDEIALWVRHLAGVAVRDDPAFRSVLCGSDEQIVLGGVAPSRASVWLDQLVAIGLASESRPIAAFPAAARVYAKKSLDGVPEPLRAARKIFEGSTNHPGDARDRDVLLVWRGRDPLSEEFERVAATVWLPYLEARREGGA